MIRVNDESIRWWQGMTVQDALNAMRYEWAHITVTVNESFVPEEEWSRFLIPDNADVRAMHLFHGG